MNTDPVEDRTQQLAQFGPDVLMSSGNPPTKEEAEALGLTYLDWPTADD